jgi:carbamoyltransferase
MICIFPTWVTAASLLAPRSRPRPDRWWRGWLDQIGLGPDYAEAQIDEALRHADLRTSRPADLAERVAGLIADGHIVMWFQGRMGDRALATGVLARPDRADLRDRLNLVLAARLVSAVLSDHARKRASVYSPIMTASRIVT